jgi:Fic family protein
MKDHHWFMKPNMPKVLMLAKRQLSEFVWDAVTLEGLNFTLPEIQALLDGITVGGHRIADQQIAVNQGEAWRTLFNWIETGRFDISMEKACQLHAIAGKEESPEWGRFRIGGVTIAGTDYLPPDAVLLPGLFDDMVKKSSGMPDIYDQAIHIFLTMASCQFFYDVNKRMGRFMMNGLLLNNGYPAINLPA